MSLLTFFLLKSTISKIELVAMLICFTAVFFASTAKGSDEETEDMVMSTCKAVGMVCALIAAATNASVNVAISQLKHIHYNV